MKKYYRPLLFFILFFILLILLKTYNVEAIGPMNTEVGFARLNGSVHSLFGVHYALYNITDWLGIVAILVAAVFALVGLTQLIKRKNLLKVDKEILVLGCLYIIVIATYVLFETVIINYRPVIMPGCTEVEASFPSSHTLLICSIMGSAITLSDKYIKNRKTRKLAVILAAIIIAFTVIGRLVSGVHWFTDIVGGVLLSLAYLSTYSLIIRDNL